MLTARFEPVGHLVLPGGGQIVVDGPYAYVGHMAPPHGTSIAKGGGYRLFFVFSCLFRGWSLHPLRQFGKEVFPEEPNERTDASPQPRID